MGKKLVVLLLGCLLLAGCNCKDKIDFQNFYNIEQIKLNTSGIYGDFFLGCGTISNETLYYFYTNENGAIRLKKVSYNYVTIYYTKEQPKVIYTRTSNACSGYNYKWDIYIPEGSIVNNYDVNIK